MIKIDKGIPLAKNTGGQPSIYPWKEMKVGDSFFVSGKIPAVFRQNCYQAGHRLGMKFSCRKQPGGVRVWRIE